MEENLQPPEVTTGVTTLAGMNGNYQGARNQYKCPTCNKSFAKLQNWKFHQCFHPGEHPFQCDKCEHSFTQKGQLKSHQHTHASVKPYVCEYCEKEYVQQRSYKRHMLICTGRHLRGVTTPAAMNGDQSDQGNQGDSMRKQYQCKTCNKSFANLQSWRVHQRTHKEERPFQCNKCERSFTQNSELKSHNCMDTISVKAYVCEYCEKEFVYRAIYKRHIQTCIGRHFTIERAGTVPTDPGFKVLLLEEEEIRKYSSSVKRLKKPVHESGCAGNSLMNENIAPSDSANSPITFEGNLAPGDATEELSSTKSTGMVMVIFSLPENSGKEDLALSDDTVTVKIEEVHEDQEKVYTNKASDNEENEIHMSGMDTSLSIDVPITNKASTNTDRRLQHLPETPSVIKPHGLIDKIDEMINRNEQLLEMPTVLTDFASIRCNKTSGRKEQSNLQKKEVDTSKRPYSFDKCSKSVCTKQQLVSHPHMHTDIPAKQKKGCSDETTSHHSSTEKLIEESPSTERGAVVVPKEGMMHKDQVTPLFLSKELAELICFPCNRTFSSKAQFRKHTVRFHTKERPFACNKCDYAFVTQRELTRHTANVHNREDSSDTDHSDSEDLSDEETQDHSVFSDKGIQDHPQCSEQTQELPQPLSQQQDNSRKEVSVEETVVAKMEKAHKDTQVGLPKELTDLTCVICNLAFSSKEHLQMHNMRLHTGVQLFTCNQCDYTSGKQRRLQRHMRKVHDRKLVCLTCGTFFPNKQDLRKHKQTHIGNPPYRCDDCGQTLSQKNQLNYHQQKYHADAVIQKFFLCTVCQKSFKSKDRLERHALNHADVVTESSSADLNSTIILPEDQQGGTETISGIQKETVLDSASPDDFIDTDIENCKSLLADGDLPLVTEGSGGLSGSDKNSLSATANGMVILSSLPARDDKEYCTASIEDTLVVKMEDPDEECWSHESSKREDPVNIHAEKTSISTDPSKGAPVPQTGLSQHPSHPQSDNNIDAVPARNDVRQQNHIPETVETAFHENHVTIPEVPTLPEIPEELASLICVPCHRTFSSKRELKIHTMRVHTGERPYKCDKCGYACVDQRALNRHQRKHNVVHACNQQHGEEQSLACKECDYHGKDYAELRKHMYKHANKHVCEVCGSQYTQLAAYKKHISNCASEGRTQGI